MTLRIVIAGVTGTLGSGVARAVLAAPDMTLVAAVARGAAGRDVGEALGMAPLGIPVHRTIEEAFAVPADIFIDYTSPLAIKRHTDAAIARGLGVVIGASGLTHEDYDEIDRAARARGVGAAVGAFSLVDALWQRFALEAARHLQAWEIIDYADAAKSDSPSGTARELADRLAAVARPVATRPAADTVGPIEARGATVAGSQLHSVRIPGYVFACEAIFGALDERLILRVEQTSHARVFIAGTLIAARRLPAIKGLVRGFDRLLFGET
ncbi:MAG: 4-hydroxy-tetrahydrodipicolinate reductase [Alphaproteobacteria bacterium]|nr:4-hydroxy-tetrahydrodipicolinate reductase [Alphaproteobacteria bacterium]